MTDLERHELIRDEVDNALNSGDYVRCLELWDFSVVRSKTVSNDQQLLEAANRIEFTYNLICATHPFRVSTLRESSSTSQVAKTAARSMTIFKNYIQSRGQVLISTEREFMNYRILHKVAFPPTHPMFRHLFTDDWLMNAKMTVLSFIESINNL